MKKFFLIILIVLFAISMLAACAPLENLDVEGYARMLPGWVIIVGAVIIFFIGFGIIWKLVPGFIKVIALIALAVVVAGTAYGLWNIPLVDKAIDKVDSYMEQSADEQNTGE